MSKLSILEAERADYNIRIESAIKTGDYDSMVKSQRAASELADRIFFEQTKQIREQIAEMEADRLNAMELLKDFDEELQTAAQVVTDCRSRLYDAEKDYANIKSRQFALDVDIESRRTAIKETKARLDRHIQSRLNGSGEQTAANHSTQFDLLNENFICD